MTTKIEAGNYLLIKVEDLPYITHHMTTGANVFVEIQGKKSDLAEIETRMENRPYAASYLPNGNLRLTAVGPVRARSVHENIRRNLAESAQSHNVTIETSLGTNDFVGSLLDGSEANGPIVTADPITGHPVTLLSFSKDVSLDFQTDSKGISKLGSAPKAAAKSTRKRNTKGHFEKQPEASPAK